MGLFDIFSQSSGPKLSSAAENLAAKGSLLDILPKGTGMVPLPSITGGASGPAVSGTGQTSFGMVKVSQGSNLFLAIGVTIVGLFVVWKMHK